MDCGLVERGIDYERMERGISKLKPTRRSSYWGKRE